MLVATRRLERTLLRRKRPELWQHHRVTERIADAATRPARGPRRQVRRRTLLIMHGDEIESRHLPLAGTLTVGRGDTADIRVAEPSLSRTHLRLVLGEDSIAVVDLGSANGTTLRGARLPSHVAVEISANEQLGAGDLTLVIQELGPLDATPIGPARPSTQLAMAASAPVVLDPAMRRLYELAARIARGSIPVLLVGETGTGKEVFAEYLHAASTRSAGPLVRVNCAALTDSLVESELFGHEKGAFTGAQRERRGLLESADTGTVFLDEVGEMPLAMQAKLLRVLEDGRVLRVGGSSPRPIDVRFVAATNRDLELEVGAGRFRRDLYFRLAGAVIAIPALRDRRAEIEPLAEQFAAHAAQRLGRPAPGFTSAARTTLRAHTWPGNVRELRNVVERAVLLAETAIDVDHLMFGAPLASAQLPPSADASSPPPVSVDAGAPLADQLASLERERIVDALARCHGNQTRAAELLGMPRRTLIKRLDQYGISRPRKK